MPRETLYRQNILDHYKNPRNFRKPVHPDCHARDSNPLCGDELEFGLKISKSSRKIEEISFYGKGCAISISSASMLTELAKGKTISDAMELKKEELLREIGIDPGPTRLKCAMLPLKVLKLALAKYIGKK